MKAKNAVGKIYVRPNAYLGRSETFCSGFCRETFKLQFFFCNFIFSSLPRWHR